MNLFSPTKDNNNKYTPLATRMRPNTLEELVGQEHILGKGKLLRRAIEQDELHSLILWGPPGTGKTTLAYIIANVTGAEFVWFSAVLSGVKEGREIIKKAEYQRDYLGKKTILFVDEIHRFNKAQQDAFLPCVEKGIVILIGATTENPSFEINSALLSRSRVFVLKALEIEHIEIILHRALKDKKLGLGKYSTEIDDNTLEYIAMMSGGDARIALNALELAVMTTSENEMGIRIISKDIAIESLQKGSLLYDKGAEEHYNLISALHKSLRDSDPQGALYWMARMVESGEDPLYIVRRLIRFASEDVGLADPQALVICNAVKDTIHFIGLPEGKLALAQATVYLALAPKSNALYSAYSLVEADIKKYRALPVPLHIRNAPTKLMKELDYSKGYKYAHDYEDGIVEQEHLPEELKGHIYYKPTERGFEIELKKRLRKIEELRKKGKE